jgi:predicted DNA binding CopG/RHH family protein
MDRFRLDQDEQRLEDSAQEHVPVSDEERKRVEQIIERSRKKKNINIRLNESDLNSIKTRALRRHGVRGA